MPSANTRELISPSWPANSAVRSKKLCPPPVTPSRLGIWVIAIVNPAPALNPTRMLSLMSRTSMLSRSSHAISKAGPPCRPRGWRSGRTAAHLRPPSSQRCPRSSGKSQRSVRLPVGARSQAARSRGHPANSRKCPLAGADPQVRHRPGKLESRRPPAWPRRSHRWPTIQPDSPPASELVVHAEAKLARSAVSSGLELGATAATPRGSSVRFTDEISALQRRLIVIPAFAGSLRQLDLCVRDFLVGDRPQDVRDAIEPRAPLVVGPHDMPWRVLAVRRLQHHVARPRIIIPASV